MSSVEPATSPAQAFRQRLLAEALRRQEEATGVAVADAQADLAAIAAGGDFETRLRRRAQTLAERSGLEATLTQFESAIRIAFLITIAAGLIIGAGVAQSTLTPDQQGLVNFYWVLVALLGIHTVALLLWLVLLAAQPVTPLRAPFNAVVRMLVPAGRGSAVNAPATWTGLLGTGALGRWGLSTLVHTFWIAALAGMLATVLLLLSARQFTFVWETTILPDRVFVATTTQIARLPRHLGLPAPDHETILASRRNGEHTPPPQARRMWSSLLIGSLIAYGMLPRAFALLLSLLFLRRACARYRLDVDLPGYARLRSALMPPSRRIGVVDADSSAVAQAQMNAQGRLPVAPGTAVLGIEIDDPLTGWPPAIVREARDLGIARDRDALKHALRMLASLQHAPLALLAVASLATSPDRGVTRLLRELRATHHGPFGLLLTQAGKTRDRLGAENCEERIADWLRVAAGAGIERAHVGVLDLDDIDAVRAHHFARESDSPTGVQP